jgi:uncharacterized protein YbcI
MDTPGQLKQRVVDAVGAFQRDQMSVSPESVTVDFHSNRVVVTLQGASSPAERAYARERSGREMLETFYDALFGAVKPTLETAIAEILGRPVQRSRLTVDAESGDGVILFTLA